jgi:hypothetical protein
MRNGKSEIRNGACMTEERIREVLAVSGDGEVMEAVMTVLEFTARQEMMAAIGPNVTGENRAYNAGRAAAAEDIRAVFREMTMAK